MESANEEASKRFDESARRAREAEDASVALGIEIGNLNEEEITSETSSFLAGLMLGREIERTYLENYIALFNDGSEVMTKALEDGRKEVGELLNILHEAKVGNTEHLREFVLSESEAFEWMSRDFANEIDYKPKNDKYQMASQNMKLIAEKLVANTHTDNISMPKPAWMEQPLPLKIQLEQLKQGGDTTS